MKVLVTGFDPFDNEKINPSYEAAKLLPDVIDGAQIVIKELPTVFGVASEKLTCYLDAERPDIVICTGQAGGRDAVTPERVAINVKDARIPDNRGNMPSDEPLYEGEREAYFSSLPIKEIIKSIEKEGIPARISNSAGTFVCNEVMYTLLRYVERVERRMIGGFVHIPYIPEQTATKVNVYSLSLEESSGALLAAIKTTIKYLREQETK